MGKSIAERECKRCAIGCLLPDKRIIPGIYFKIGIIVTPIMLIVGALAIWLSIQVF